MKLEDIINDIIYQTIQAVKLGDDQDMANIHTQAHNRLSGYDDNGNKVAYGYSNAPILTNKRGEE
jgi:hypothetical protein